MILKVKDSIKLLFTVIQVSRLEYNYNYCNEAESITIWDLSNKQATVVAHGSDLLYTVCDLYSKGRAEIDGEVVWE